MLARFENLVASHLLKWVHYQRDIKGHVELRYFRDTDRREVDFLVVERNVPLWSVECKWADGEVDGSLAERFVMDTVPYRCTAPGL